MAFLEYLFHLGIVYIAFGFIWKWLFNVPLSVLLVMLKATKGKYLVRAFGAYLQVSLTTLLALAAIEKESDIGSILLFALTGTAILYAGFASNSNEAQKIASITGDHELLKSFQYDAWFVFGAPLLFVITLFLPALAVNPLTLWLLGIIEWAYNLPVLGWLLGIGGFLFLISTLWDSVMASKSFLGRLRKA